MVRAKRGRLSGWGRRLNLIVVAYAACVASVCADTPAPSGCSDISAQPPTYSGIEFGSAIQANIFVNFLPFPGMAGCADCHTTNMGTQTPSGNLDLDPQDTSPPYDNIVGVPSFDDSTIQYVVPKHPEQSLIFWKVNCANPVVGSQMPYEGYPDGMTTLTPYQMAQLWDWIAEGAPVAATDGVFRGTFDIRGLFIDDIFNNGFEAR